MKVNFLNVIQYVKSRNMTGFDPNLTFCAPQSIQFNFNIFDSRYEILCPNVIPKGFMDAKLASEKMVSAIEKHFDNRVLLQ
jgi:hypothetical protein